MTREDGSGVSAETVTAVAIATALVAIAVGVWDNIQTRQHNRLSVIPHLVFVAELGELGEPGDELSGEPREGGTLTLRNEGVGPAVVDSVSVVASGRDLPLLRFAVDEATVADTLETVRPEAGRGE